MGKIKTYEVGYRFPNTWLSYVEDAPPRLSPKNKKIRQIRVLCHFENCTNITTVDAGNANMEHVLSCGCFDRRRAFETNYINYEIGHHFENTWLKYDGEAGYVSRSSGRIRLVYAICNYRKCGNRKSYHLQNLTSEHTATCGCARNATQLCIFNNIVKPLVSDAVSEYMLSNGQKLDIAVPSLMLAIQFDGKQHDEIMYYDKGDYSKLKERQALDIEKNQLVESIGWELLRIPEKDYGKNKKMWKSKIEDFINQAQVK